MKKYLVIVESPSKAKTIEKILGKNYKVKASYGHVIDLPKTTLGIDVENDFKANYKTIKGKGPILQELKKEAKKSDIVYLASDLDREGEAIAWHISNYIKQPKKIKRIVFNEITKTAVKTAIKSPRDIDINLVDAQQARRLLDRLVGYKISPLLWTTIGKNASAGRVQSVTLKIICDLEDEIKAFIPKEYREFSVLLKNGLELNLTKVKGKKVDKIFDKEFNFELSEFLLAKKILIKKRTQKPPQVFKTSTLQQLASSYLGFSTSKTMRIAQQLYEGLDIFGETRGLITYMRTDSTRVSKDAQDSAQKYIESKFGKEYVGNYTYKNKNAQDAHEGIRPSYLDLEPDKIAGFLSKDQYKLYLLIWNRFITSQFAAVQYNQMQITAVDKELEFTGTVNKITFDGYYKYQKSEDDIITKELPDLNEGDKLEIDKLNVKNGITKAPTRFSEATIVKKLETLGIGRPSTYASIIDNLVRKEYVSIDAKRLIPTVLGYEIKEELVKNFEDIMDTNFTSSMENELDDIAESKLNYIDVLKKYYSRIELSIDKYEVEVDKIKNAVIKSDVLDKNGNQMLLKTGRFGKYLISTSDDAEKISLKNIEISKEEVESGFIHVKEKINEKLKIKNGFETDYSEDGTKYVLKLGRFGYYLESENYQNDNKRITLTPQLRAMLNKEAIMPNNGVYNIKEYIIKEKNENDKLINEAGKCDKCGSVFAIKKGRFGKFLACSSYPKCKNIKNIKKGSK